MLEKPAIDERDILSHAQAVYKLHAVQLTFLPLGVDMNTAVYRLQAEDGIAYFLKLRKGSFDEISVTVPHFLWMQGIQEIIPPLEAMTGQYWIELRSDPDGRSQANPDASYKMILYPFIAGQDGYQIDPSERQWLAFGAALKRIHSTQVPPALARLIPHETYSPRGRERVKTFQVQAAQNAYEDPSAAKLAAYMQEKRGEIDRLVARGAALAAARQARPPEMVLCHSDIHPGNLLLGADEALHIVDWDNPIFAPKERDLLLIGGCPNWDAPYQADLFYHGYNQGDKPVQIDPLALAYYRHERITQDIAEFCQQLLATNEGGEDREQALEYFCGQFAPGHEIDIAFKTDIFL